MLLLWCAGSHIKALRLATDSETGSSKGFAHVEFEDEDAAASAIEKLSGSQLLSRPIRANFSRPKERRDTRETRGDGGARPYQAEGCEIHIGNLDKSFGEDVLKELVDDIVGANQAVKFRVPKDRETGEEEITYIS